jgi:hypothetical protein
MIPAWRHRPDCFRHPPPGGSDTLGERNVKDEPAIIEGGLMDDERDVLGRIRELVDEEHELRAGLSRGELGRDEEHSRLAALEVQLDQCWDLLRQRRARSSAGLDPGEAQVRPAREVEGYLG